MVVSGGGNTIEIRLPKGVTAQKLPEKAGGPEDNYFFLNDAPTPMMKALRMKGPDSVDLYEEFKGELCQRCVQEVSVSPKLKRRNTASMAKISPEEAAAQTTPKSKKWDTAGIIKCIADFAPRFQAKGLAIYLCTHRIEYMKMSRRLFIRCYWLEVHDLKAVEESYISQYRIESEKPVPSDLSTNADGEIDAEETPATPAELTTNSTS